MIVARLNAWRPSCGVSAGLVALPANAAAAMLNARNVPSPRGGRWYAAQVIRMRKRLAVWEIFMAYMRDGARSWSQVQQAITPEDFEKIMTICDGIPLRDLLLDLR